MKARILIMAVLACFVFSCSNDDDAAPYQCTTCVDSPVAIAANDASGKGIYKGIFIGSSGTITFNIANSGSTIDAVLVLDGETISLTTTGTFDIVSGFEGLFINTSEGVSIGFFVNGSGTAYGTYSVEIVGHPDAIVEAVKEFSTGLVKVFEGEYAGTHTGTMNLITRNDEWELVADSGSYFEGEIGSDGSLSCTGGDCLEVSVTGRISGDVVNGEWDTLGNSDQGTWEGRRTL